MPSFHDLELCKVLNTYHGGLDYRELADMGISPDEVLDFSVNCNPFGPPAGIRQSLKEARIDRYPDRESLELRQALAGNLGVSHENIVAGNGSTELFRLIALTFFQPSDKIMTVSPTYGEYENAIYLARAMLHRLTLREAEDFRLDTDRIVEDIRKNRPRGIFLCNPNNPTGEYLSREGLERILVGADGCPVVLDEAYVAFADGRWDSLELIEKYNLIVVRSMTKDYALAGLRLGYAVASRELTGVLSEALPPWNVNAFAQRAGVAALKDRTHILLCKDKIFRARSFLTGELQKLGLKPLPSSVNFFLLKVGSGRDFRQALLKKKILVRDCASFGLPQYVRIAVRTIPECRKLIEAIKSLCHCEEPQATKQSNHNPDKKNNVGCM